MGNSPPTSFFPVESSPTQTLETVQEVPLTVNLSETSNLPDDNSLPTEELEIKPLGTVDSSESVDPSESSSSKSSEPAISTATPTTTTVDLIAAAVTAALVNCGGESKSSGPTKYANPPKSTHSNPPKFTHSNPSKASYLNPSKSSTNSRVLNAALQRVPRGRPSKHGRGSSSNRTASSQAHATYHGLRVQHATSLPNVYISASPVEPRSPVSKSVSSSINGDNPPPKPFVAVGKPEVVHVVHVKDPSSFYVHRDQDKAILDDLQKYLDVCPERELDPPIHIAIGQMYICKFLVDDKWYRVTVRKCSTMLNPPESRDAIIDIFYLDYGNSDRVPLSRLRPMPAQLIDVPPYALHCSVFDLHPKQGDGWSEDARRTFCKMVNGVRVHMKVMSFQDDLYHIDLCAIPGMKYCNFPVSVRDAMVYMDMAYLEDETRLNIRQSSALFDSEYLKEDPLNKGEHFPVVLSHIDNPSMFYAQRRGTHAEYLTKLLDDMSQFYKENKGDLVYDPGVGMPCAAQFTLDKSWYRARVMSIPKKSWVEVFYVDYGNREEIPYTQLRKLPEKFMRIPPQAIECSLEDVMPTRGNKWPTSANEFFLSITKDKELRLLVNDVSKACTKVILYEENETVDICLNALLVREGHAQSIGVGASLVEYFKVEAALPSMDDNHVTVQFENAIKPSRKKIRKACKVDQGGVGLLETINNPLDAGLIRATGTKHANAGPPLCVAVTIIAINSPGCLYVRPCSNEEEIVNLIQEMQVFYSGVSASKNSSWQEADKCSVFSEKDQKWYRATILELLDNKAKVFYKDLAVTESIPLGNLRILHEKFANIHDGTIKCHLVGIHAAGGQKWSAVSCEMFSELVQKTYSELFITKKGEIEDNSLPIELWARNVISPGPLVPNTIDWISLNQILVNKGMAIPTTMPETLEILETNKSPSLQNNATPAYGFAMNTEDDEQSKAESDSTSSKDDTEESRRELILCPEDPRRQWLPALPLKKHHFVGLITNVDAECNIYVHNIEDTGTLSIIKDSITKFVGDSQQKPQDMYWFEGQICLAKFYADECWYRGKILKEKENNTYDVQFVDYGNIELCSVEMLRKDVIMAQVPIMCHAYQLDEILPADSEGKWKTEHLDFLHLTLDGKKCKIHIKSSLEDEVPKVSIVLPGNIDVAQLLVSMHYAIYSCNVIGNYAASEASSEDVIIEKVTELQVDNKDCLDVGEILEKITEYEGNTCSGVSSKVETETRNENNNCFETISDINISTKSIEIQNKTSDLKLNLQCENISEEVVMKDISNEATLKTGDITFTTCTEDKDSIANERSKSSEKSSTCVNSNNSLSHERDKLIEDETRDRATVDYIKCNNGRLEASERIAEINETKEITYTSVGAVDDIEPVETDNENVHEIKSLLLPAEYYESVESDSENACENISSPQATKDHILWSEEVEDQKEQDFQIDGLSYCKLNLENCDTLTVQVTAIMDSVAEIVMIPERNGNEEVLSKTDFDIMTLQIQNEAALQPIVEIPYIGQPCCAQYSEDEQYYRASIVEIRDDGSKTKVEFVDYGNVEWIDTNRIHEIKPAWLAVPTNGIRCKLWNIRIAEDCERRVVLKGMSNLIFDRLLTAKIKERNPLAVELYQFDSDNLIYQPLLDTGLLVNIHDEKCDEEKLQ